MPTKTAEKKTQTPRAPKAKEGTATYNGSKSNTTRTGASIKDLEMDAGSSATPPTLGNLKSPTPPSVKNGQKPKSETAAELFARGKKLADEHQPEPLASDPSQPMPSMEIPKIAPQPFLNGTQERMADLIGELIVTGGSRRDLDLIIRAALDHEGRRFYEPLISAVSKEPGGFEGQVARHVAKYFPLWSDNLAAARARHETLPEVNRPEPKTVTEMIRAHKREQLSDEFDEFLSGANPEEIQFLEQVMVTWRSIHSGWGNGYESVYIANAFEEEIGRRRDFIRVPYHLVDDVEDYIRVMLKAQPEAA